jgi:P-type E1-E2 ATPase
MIKIDIPGRGRLELEHLVMDVNGTIASDGSLLEGTAELIAELGKHLEVHLVTADTHGSQSEIDRQLGLTAIRVPAANQAEAKLEYVRRLGVAGVAAVGNGANDARMLAQAALGIAVLGREGAASETLSQAAVVVIDIRDALGLLLHPKRLIATLRR